MTELIYKVTAWPSGNFWLLEVAGLSQNTQARSVKEIDVMVRDFIACSVGGSPDSVSYELRYLLPTDVNEALDEAARLREVADKARKDAAQASTRAAKILQEQGFKVRDIGAALGISFQRAQQLLSR